MLKQTKGQDFEEDTIFLAKAARVIHKDIANVTGFKFAGTFPSGCLQESVFIS